MVTFRYCFLVLAVLSTGGCKKTKCRWYGLWRGIKNADWRSNIGDSFEVEGYYDEVGGIGNYWMHPNITMWMPRHLKGLYLDRNQHPWLLCRIILNISAENQNQRCLAGRNGIISCRFIRLLGTSRWLPAVGSLRLIDSVSYFQRPGGCSACATDIRRFVRSLWTRLQPRVAFLYSGGINSGSAYQRYYNDIRRSIGFYVTNTVILMLISLFATKTVCMTMLHPIPLRSTILQLLPVSMQPSRTYREEWAAEHSSFASSIITAVVFYVR